jgi:phosphatidylserine/phosphatidylglycerophosphate/cardiolipin synthase-like enzyme
VIPVSTIIVSLSVLLGCSGADSDTAPTAQDTVPSVSDTNSDTEDTGGDTGDTGGGDTGSPEPVALTRASFSVIGQAALDALSVYGGSRHVTWNYSADASFESGWVLQTPPESHWGMAAESFSADVTCTGGDCDPDFLLRYCSMQSDCVGGGTCRPIAASVASAGEAPVSMCAGHSDQLFDDFYLAITEGESFIDIVSLTEPDGRFLVAIRNALAVLDSEASEARVRLNFGSINGAFFNQDDVIEDLTRGLPSSTGLRVHVGGWRSAADSWNHAKIIAVDGQLLVQGGHNMWDPDYLQANPVHDLTMRLRGTPAVDAHHFADRLWAYTCEEHWGTSWTGRASFPGGVADCPPAYDTLPEPPLEGGPRVISAGRLSDPIGENPADEAMLAMIRASDFAVRLSQQDIGPIRIYGDITVTGWPEDLLRELAYAMARGVDVMLVLSNPSDVLGGYGNGWSIEEVAQKMESWIRDNPGIIDDGVDVHDLVCERFNVAGIRFSGEDGWADGGYIANHSKLMIADDQAFYLGSQNLYPADLAEFGLIVDDAAVTAELMEAYWDPMWTHSVQAAVSGAQAPSCSF